MVDWKLAKQLQDLRFPVPKFVYSTQNFFPHHCLVAPFAAWAVRSAVGYLDDVFAKLGIVSPLAPHKARLECQQPPIRDNPKN
jgi:hypothetical protein